MLAEGESIAHDDDTTPPDSEAQARVSSWFRDTVAGKLSADVSETVQYSHFSSQQTLPPRKKTKESRIPSTASQRTAKRLMESRHKLTRRGRYALARAVHKLTPRQACQLLREASEDKHFISGELIDTLADVLGGALGKGALDAVQHLFSDDVDEASLCAEIGTGETTTASGRRWCCDDGKRAKCPDKPKDKKKSSKKAKADTGAAASLVKSIDGNGTPEQQKELVGHVEKMTVSQMKDFAKGNNLRVSGKLKADIKASLLDALDSAYFSGGGGDSEKERRIKIYQDQLGPNGKGKLDFNDPRLTGGDAKPKDEGQSNIKAIQTDLDKLEDEFFDVDSKYRVMNFTMMRDEPDFPGIEKRRLELMDEIKGKKSELRKAKRQAKKDSGDAKPKPSKAKADKPRPTRKTTPKVGAGSRSKPKATSKSKATKPTEPIEVRQGQAPPRLDPKAVDPSLAKRWNSHVDDYEAADKEFKTAINARLSDREEAQDLEKYVKRFGKRASPHLLADYENQKAKVAEHDKKVDAARDKRDSVTRRMKRIAKFNDDVINFRDY